MMHRCRCSTTRALDLFVQDVAGLSIHRHRQHPPAVLIPQRRFRTRPPPRQSDAAVTAVHPDHDFVPFQVGRVNPKAAVAHAKPISAVQEQRVDEDWTPEIELVSPLPLSTLHSHEQPSAIEQTVQQTHHSVSTIDAVSLPLTQLPTAPHLPQAQPPTLHRPPHEQKPRPTAAVTSKAEARLARKRRRQQAGAFAPLKKAKEQQLARGVDVDQLHTVLSKIEKLEGPDVAAPPRHSPTQTQKPRPPPRARDLQPPSAAKTPPAKPTPKPPPREPWQVQKSALAHKFGEQGWRPRKRLSPDTLDGIRALHASDPAAYPTATLAAHFKVAPEAIRRILKSKWTPSEPEAEDRRVRWERRGVRKWADMAAQGVRPPAKWRAMGAGSERGVREERVPRRRSTKRRGEGLSWDEVVGDMGGGAGAGLAERLL